MASWPEGLKIGLDGAGNGLLVGGGHQARTHAALDVQNDLVGVLGILFEVFVEDDEAVAVWRAVEFAAVEVVGTRVEGCLDGCEDLVVGLGLGGRGKAFFTMGGFLSVRSFPGGGGEVGEDILMRPKPTGPIGLFRMVYDMVDDDGWL